MSDFRGPRDREVQPIIRKPPTNLREWERRARDLIMTISNAKTEALALGLMFTFRGIDKAEKAVGWELAAKHGEHLPEERQHPETIEAEYARAERAVR
jgi:hypothetical protein